MSVLLSMHDVTVCQSEQSVFICLRCMSVIFQLIILFRKTARSLAAQHPASWTELYDVCLLWTRRIWLRTGANITCTRDITAAVCDAEHGLTMLVADSYETHHITRMHTQPTRLITQNVAVFCDKRNKKAMKIDGTRQKCMPETIFLSSVCCQCSRIETEVLQSMPIHSNVVWV